LKRLLEDEYRADTGCRIKLLTDHGRRQDYVDAEYATWLEAKLAAYMREHEENQGELGI
jgi:hypothetical protein